MALFEVEHIGARYHRNGEPFVPFSDVSFSLEAGCLYNLTGPSGSGKSTLLNACALMIPRSGGTLSLAGAAQWRRRVCLVPQASALVPGTVRDNLLFPWTLKVNAGTPPPSDEVLRALLSLAMLDGVGLDHAAAQLSGGQQARVALLRAFTTRPTVMLLDEVEAALDEQSAVAVSRLTRALLTSGTTCLRIRHRAEDGYAYGVFTLDGGTMSYQQNPLTADNAPVTDDVSAHDTGVFQILASLAPTPPAPAMNARPSASVVGRSAASDGASAASTAASAGGPAPSTKEGSR